LNFPLDRKLSNNQLF